MREWLCSKLDTLTQEFLAGGGYGGVFEAQYLVYLECLVAATRSPNEAAQVWTGWQEVCAKASPPGEAPCCLSNHISDRNELVTALRQFRLTFEGPRRRIFKTPKLAEPTLLDILNEVTE